MSRVRLTGGVAGVVALSFGLAACGSDGPSAPRTGTIAVTSTVQTTIDNQNFDYTITVGSNAPRTASANTPASFNVPNVPTGAQAVTVAGLPAACTADQPTRSVNVVGGDTARVAIAVTCARTTGDLVVIATTTGSDLDADGFAVTVDNTPRGTVAANSNLNIPSISPGAHIVAISGLATNCTSTVTSRTVTVTAGTPTTVTFDIVCAPRTGAIRFVATTTGSELPTGLAYLTQVGSGANIFQLGANGTLRVTGVPPGQYTITTLSRNSNCAMSTAPVRTITVAANDTTQVSVTGACLSRGNTGVSTFSVTDPANDTLAQALGDRVQDILALGGAYHSEGWVSFRARFAAAVRPYFEDRRESVGLQLDLDLDENTATGGTPYVSTLGNNAPQGVEMLVLADGDSTFGSVVRGTSLVGLAAVQFLGDTVIIRVPLSMLNNDDGNMTITGAVFRNDGVDSDIIPNSGVITARRPAASIGAAQRTHPVTGEVAVPLEEARAALRALARGAGAASRVAGDGASAPFRRTP